MIDECRVTPEAAFSGLMMVHRLLRFEPACDCEGLNQGRKTVERPIEPVDSVELREESAQRVLKAYLERRRHRRGEDTYFGSAECFIEHEEASIDAPERERRRSEIMEDADRQNMPRELAELMYDVAREEGLDPALAFELVSCGLAVCPPADGVSNATQAPATDKYLPPWMFPADPPDRFIRERTLHLSFRRLRSLLEDCHDVDEAFRRFAHEPDVGHCGY